MKEFFKSKTIWGIAIAAIGAVVDQLVLIPGPAGLVGQVIGLLLATYGRTVAKGPLT